MQRAMFAHSLGGAPQFQPVFLIKSLATFFFPHPPGRTSPGRLAARLGGSVKFNVKWCHPGLSWVSTASTPASSDPALFTISPVPTTSARLNAVYYLSSD